MAMEKEEEYKNIKQKDLTPFGLLQKEEVGGHGAA